MPSEPNWSKQIPSSYFCTWFYVWAIINGLAGGAGVLTSLYLLLKGKTTFYVYLYILFLALISFTNSWSFFIICNRGLTNEGFQHLNSGPLMH